MSARRPRVQSSDVNDPERLATTLNDVFLDMATRIEALEAVKGVFLLPEVSFETGASVGPTVAPFSFASGGIRITCPFTPTGLLLLRLEDVRGGTASSLASDVKWHFAAGPIAADGVLHVDFVTGLAVNTSYRMRVGATRA